MEQMKAQAEHVGTEIISDTITEVRLKEHPSGSKAIQRPGLYLRLR